MIPTTIDFDPEQYFSTGIRNVPTSFIREILKVTADPSIISFAGGLPNADFLPLEELAASAGQVLRSGNRSVLQYAVSEGYLPLREWIAQRYASRFGWEVKVEEILITSGSQQALDLIGKVFLDSGDRVLLENPSYLGAIQAFSVYRPWFVPVALCPNGIPDGMDITAARQALRENRVKFCYCIPNFQNPTGISYSTEKRTALAEMILSDHSLLVEDDPYSELYFDVTDARPPVTQLTGRRGILLGSFSKVVSPGLRLGWVVADPRIISRLVRAKQVADLHSSNLSQQVIHHFLMTNDFDKHLERIRTAYRRQKELMQEAIQVHFPKAVSVTDPKGGMFLWATLPATIDAGKLVDQATKAGVLFVPGSTFHTDGKGLNTLRLNFSNASRDQVLTGIRRLGDLLASTVDH